MDRTKTIALVLGPSLAVLALLAGYFWKDHAQTPGTPLELHDASSAAAQHPGAADVAAKSGSLSPLEPKSQDLARLLDKTAKADRKVPQFDIVRVEPKGDIVVAGHGEGNATVAVLSDGEVIAEGKADAAGQFVLIPPALAPGDHNLALRSTPQQGGGPVHSEQRVAVYVPREKGEEAAVALAEPGKPTVLMKDPTAAAEKAAPEAAEAKAPEPAAQPLAGGKAAAKNSETKSGETKPEAFSAKVPENAGKPEAMPKPHEAKPVVSIKTAEVVEPGGFFATGQAAPGAHVRLYLNGSILAEVIAGKDGHWSVKVGKGLIPGQYAVRADQIDGKGQVVARAEVQFHFKNEAKVAVQAPAPASAHPAKPEELKPSAAQASSEKPQSPPSQPEVAVNRPSESKPTDIKSSESKASESHAGEGKVGESKSAAVTLKTETASADDARTASVAESPAKLSENAVVAEIQTTTVEKGNSLWRISRQTLGRGMRYTEIYAANSTQIRDPKLIYPGQVFVIPGQIN